jgi:organic radical activating enzyme
MKGRISEVFSSIQGEGMYVGEKQIFVRFFGCNLVCTFCDTPLNGFSEYQPHELMREIEFYSDGIRAISFTGGEPLLQKDFLKEVLRLTTGAGYKNYLETNGTLARELEDIIEYVDIVAMDFKLPSSAGMGNLGWLHRDFLQTASRKEVFIKAVVCNSTSEDDFHFCLKTIKEVNRFALLVLQPNSYEKSEGLLDKMRRFKELAGQKGIIACIIPQVHKALGLR